MIWNYLYDFHIKFLPLLIIYYYIVLKGLGKIKGHQSLSLSILWFIFVFTGIIMQGKPFNHYYIQLLPSICFLIPELTATNPKFRNISKKIRNILVAGISGIIILTGIVNQSFYFYTPDYPRIIAGKLKHEIQQGDLIFTTNYRHIIYYLLDTDIPSRYVHPSLLTLSNHIDATGINPAKEINRILLMKPEYIIIQDSFFMYDSEKMFRKYYTHYKTYNDNILVYKLISLK